MSSSSTRGTSTKSLWLVDAYNVLRVSLAQTETHSEPRPSASSGGPGGNHWWGAQRRQLLQSLARRLSEPAREICLVFDARHLSRADEPEPAVLDDPSQPLVRTLFTPSADEWIVAAVRARTADFDPIFVVTADRPLGDRARARGAVVVSTARFVELCREPGGPIE
jgi:hypothetical protein